jgi:hypothetical protein
MAIRKIISLAAAAFFFVSTPALANQCLTIDGFHEVLMSKGIKSYGSSAAATQRMETLINKNRAKADRAPIDASIVLVAYGQDQAGQITVVVAVVGKDGCVIEDTFTTLSADMWLAFLSSSGVELEEFIPIDGA